MKRSQGKSRVERRDMKGKKQGKKDGKEGGGNATKFCKQCVGIYSS